MLPSLTMAGWILAPVVGLLLAGWGFYCLLCLIPQTQQNPNVRTDIFVQRASLWSIVVGLACTAAWLVAAIVVDSIAVLETLRVLR
jgi:hypothetical protein